jgi:hypothetical protein
MTVADYDGDGHDDVIIGAKDQNDGDTPSGSLSTQAIEIVGETDNDKAGAASSDRFGTAPTAQPPLGPKWMATPPLMPLARRLGPEP